MNKACLFLVLASALIIGACGGGSDTREATTLITDHWRENRKVLPMGQVKVIGTGGLYGDRKIYDVTKGEISSADFRWYDVLEKEGLVKITNNQDLTNTGTFSWDNWFALTQGGVQQKVTVRLTSDNSQLRCSDTIIKLLGRKELICIDGGSGTVEEIVRSEKFEVGTGQFWLLMGNHRWQWGNLMKKFRSATGQSVDEKRKFMVLAKYDPFLKKWAIDGFDHALRSEAFPNQAAFDQVLASATKK